MDKNKDLFGVKQGCIKTGAIFTLIAIVAYIWIQSHSPGTVSWTKDIWVFNPLYYYCLLILIIYIGINGIVNLFRGLQFERSNNLCSPNKATVPHKTPVSTDEVGQKPPVSIQVCPSCGVTSENDAVFCSNCGARMK